MYRTEKLIRRNPWNVALTSLFLIAMSAAGSYSLLQQRKALTEGEWAGTINRFLHDVLTLANPEGGGHADMKATELPSTAAAYSNQHSVLDPAVQGDVHALLGDAFAANATGRGVLFERRS